MARKKSVSRQGSATPESPGPDASKTVEASGEAGDVQGDLASPVPAPPAGDAEDVHEQLRAAKAEIESLKAVVKTKDEEIETLKKGQCVQPRDQSKTEDMQKLQERLSQLKREQAEADAAKEAAWRQLKSVVQEISVLSAPSQAPAAPPTAT